MTQTSSPIIVTVKSSMEYAELCMGMRLANVRYSAESDVSRLIRATGGAPTADMAPRPGTLTPSMNLEAPWASWTSLITTTSHGFRS
jgi:hypothetical protein